MKNVQKLIDQANELLEKNNYDEAEPFLLVSLKHEKNNPEVYYLLGEVYCKQMRFDESIEMLHKADTLSPDNPEIVHLLGWAYFMNKNVEKGRALMVKALQWTENDDRHLCDLAVLEMNEMNFELAKTYAAKARELNPDDELVQEVALMVERMMNLQSLQKTSH